MASDLVLLTYSRNFRSASGVLNAAVQLPPSPAWPRRARAT
ncbi:MAG: hypothetical protein WDO13_19355 [Verrucomicrobiota bacterium]